MTAPVLIAWSHPDFCALCRGDGVVQFRWCEGRLSGHGVTACPHSTDPRTAVPILSVPLYRDLPRQEAA